MDQQAVEQAVAGLPIQEVRYYPQVGSTNDVAARWAEAGANDLALVIADEQTAGRGRGGRRWFTPSGAALALSLVLRPRAWETHGALTRFTGLGALAVCEALEHSYGLNPAIKWPNDVLLEGRKLAGVLAEGHWLGDTIQALILGIGINIAPQAVPPDELLNFPATCLETALGRPVDRLVVLRAILQALVRARLALASPAFIHAWEARLAYQGSPVQAFTPTGEVVTGQILGLTVEGYLRLQAVSGELLTLKAGDARLGCISVRGQ